MAVFLSADAGRAFAKWMCVSVCLCVCVSAERADKRGWHVRPAASKPAAVAAAAVAATVAAAADNHDGKRRYTTKYIHRYIANQLTLPRFSKLLLKTKSILLYQ